MLLLEPQDRAFDLVGQLVGLLDPFFGNSLIIWAVLIGTVLLYLTVGYYVGGRWADRKPYYHVMYQITAWAAFLIDMLIGA